MLQNALREDALTAVRDGYELRVGLPWIRSMPLSGISRMAVTVDGEAVEEIAVRLGERMVSPDALPWEAGWWFIQDRLVVVLPAGRWGQGEPHDVTVDFQLMVPYLQAGEGSLVLPFHLVARLRASQAVPAGVSRDVS